MGDDHYVKKGHMGNAEALNAFCEVKHLDNVRDYALRNLEYLESAGPINVDPKHMYKLIHNSDMIPFFKRMVDRVVTSLMEIKEDKKKPIAAIYEEISKLKDEIKKNKEEDNGVETE